MEWSLLWLYIEGRKLSRVFNALGRIFAINIVKAALGRNSDVNFRRAVLETCSVMWNFGIKSEFAVAPRKNTKILDWFGWSQDLPNVY
jgi:hypothetical protein